MRKATHGYSIVERRDGHRIDHYPRRSTNNFEVAKVRILALARDIRLKHLPERVFEVWDGVDAICKFKVASDGRYRIVPYLLQPTNQKEVADLEQDYWLSVKNRVKNQKNGRDRGDITSWIAQKPMDAVSCKMVDKSSWKQTFPTKSIVFGR